MNALRKFDLRERAGVIVLVLAVWLAGVLAFFTLVNIPRSEQVAALSEANSLFESQLAERKRRVEGLRAEYERVMDGRRTLRTFYDDVLSTKRERMTAVQSEVRRIASRFNINPETISYSRHIYEGDQIVKFSAVLPLTGSYENLRAFINAVENSDNFLTVESINLSDSKEGGVILSLNITLSTYFFDPDVKPTKRTSAERT